MGNEREFYSEQEFKDGCWINFIMGMCFGIVFLIASVGFYGWVNNWY